MIAQIYCAVLAAGQDGYLFIPAAFVIGILAGAKISEIKEVIECSKR